MEILLSGLFAAVVAVVITLFVQSRQRVARIRGNWSALFIEVRECGRLAEVFLTEDPHVDAPLYRLPVISFKTCYPFLLADRALQENGADILLRFFNEVQSFNRGLDLADEVERANRLQGPVFNRNRSKAEPLRNPDGALYVPALQLCRARRPS